MWIPVTLVIATCVLFGVLVLPYSALLSLVSAGIALAAGTALYVRRRAQMRRALLASAGVCAAGVLLWVAVLMPWANQEVVSGVETLNPTGTTGSAWIVYHPGRSDLQERAVRGFAAGLVDSGWRVALTTASGQAPVPPPGTTLLVVGAQSYTWAPARPVQEYLRRLGALDGLPVVAILSGLGETGPSADVMRALIGEVGGTLLALYPVWQLRPIDEVYGSDDPFEALRAAARALRVPQ